MKEYPTNTQSLSCVENLITTSSSLTYTRYTLERNLWTEIRKWFNVKCKIRSVFYFSKFEYPKQLRDAFNHEQCLGYCTVNVRFLCSHECLCYTTETTDRECLAYTFCGYAFLSIIYIKRPLTDGNLTKFSYCMHINLPTIFPSTLWV